MLQPNTHSISPCIDDVTHHKQRRTALTRSTERKINFGHRMLSSQLEEILSIGNGDRLCVILCNSVYSSLSTNNTNHHFHKTGPNKKCGHRRNRLTNYNMLVVFWASNWQHTFRGCWMYFDRCFLLNRILGCISI